MKIWHQYLSSHYYSWFKIGVDFVLFFVLYWYVHYSSWMYWFISAYGTSVIAFTAALSALVSAEIKGLIARFKRRQKERKDEQELEELTKSAFMFTSYEELMEELCWPKRAYVFMREQPKLMGWHTSNPKSGFWRTSTICWDEENFTVLSAFEDMPDRISLRTGLIGDYGWSRYQGFRVSTDWHVFDSAEELYEYVISRGYGALASRTAQEII